MPVCRLQGRAVAIYVRCPFSLPQATSLGFSGFPREATGSRLLRVLLLIVKALV